MHDSSNKLYTRGIEQLKLNQVHYGMMCVMRRGTCTKRRISDDKANEQASRDLKRDRALIHNMHGPGRSMQEGKWMI